MFCNSEYENHKTLYLWISCEFLDFCHRIFWYHLMQINLPMIILGQMIVFCNWFHWKFNNFTQKISTFIPICFEKLFALFASVCLQTILFAEKCKQFLFANNLQSIVIVLKKMLWNLEKIFLPKIRLISDAILRMHNQLRLTSNVRLTSENDTAFSNSQVVNNYF